MSDLATSRSHRAASAARHALALISTVALAACQDAPSAPTASQQSTGPDAAVVGGGCGTVQCPPPPPQILFIRDTSAAVLRYIYKAYPDGSGLTRLTYGYDPAWSPDRTKIAFARFVSMHWQIFTMNADGTGVTQVTFDPHTHYRPVWSPGGGRIAFNGNLADTANTDLYVMNKDGSNVVRITSKAAIDDQPTWSPDGKYLAFSSTRVGARQLFRINVDGTTHVAQQLTHDPKQADYPAYSPDGTKLLYNGAYVGAGCSLYVANADGTNPKPIVNGQYDCWDGSFSPNGQQIAYASRTNYPYPNYNIFVMNLDGTGVKAVTKGTVDSRSAAWSR
jgi:tol-pal system beta propeller repeat protein TolB